MYRNPSYEKITWFVLLISRFYNYQVELFHNLFSAKPSHAYFVVHAYMYLINSVYLLTTTIMSTIRCFSFTTLYKTKSLINLHKKQNKYLISKVGESTSVGESTKHPEKKRKIHHYVCNITNGDFPTQVEPISVKEVPCPSYHCVDGGNPHCQKRNKSSS